MPARIRRRSTAAATALVAALTTGGVLLLTACDPDGSGDSAAPTTSAGPGGGSAGSAGTTGPTGSPAPGRTLNGTANSRLTISTGTSKVVMNGTVVDFGTVVRDLSWSPNGRKAAFIDGSGSLVVSNPDGTGKVTVARNPGGQTWSHPAWQVTTEDKVNHIEPRNNIFFAVAQGGDVRLKSVPATAVNGTPTVLSLNAESGDTPQLPQTGNTWPNTGGDHGTAVYANTPGGTVYIRDDYLRQQGGKITEGSQPALAPDAEEIVFVRSVAGHDHVLTERLDGSQPRDLTPGATTDYTEPTWSPDGRTLAVRTPEGIATLPADGSKAPTLVSTYPGLPAYRPAG